MDQPGEDEIHGLPILYVDDELENLALFELQFACELNVSTASGGAQALARLIPPAGHAPKNAASDARNWSPAFSECVVPVNAPTTVGQAHGRLCKKCETLAFGRGVCFRGALHDLDGSGDYAGTAQHQWRHCEQCEGVWFSGTGGQGELPGGARSARRER